MNSSRRFLLDSSAFMTLTDREPGHERVSELLQKAEAGDLELYACFVSLTEVQYNAEYDHGPLKAREIIALIKTLPVTWIHSDAALCAEAATFKARHKVSFADAFVLAAAQRAQATLIHKDPELAPLAGQIPQAPLPLKTSPPASH